MNKQIKYTFEENALKSKRLQHLEMLSTSETLMTLKRRELDCSNNFFMIWLKPIFCLSFITKDRHTFSRMYVDGELNGAPSTVVTFSFKVSQYC